MKKKKLTGIAATALLALTLISINFNDSDDRSIQTAGSVAETPPAINLDQQSENAYLVVKVVDGDTIIVDIDGAEERVRPSEWILLIGASGCGPGMFLTEQLLRILQKSSFKAKG